MPISPASYIVPTSMSVYPSAYHHLLRSRLARCQKRERQLLYVGLVALITISPHPLPCSLTSTCSSFVSLVPFTEAMLLLSIYSSSLPPLIREARLASPCAIFWSTSTSSPPRTSPLEVSLAPIRCVAEEMPCFVRTLRCLPSPSLGDRDRTLSRQRKAR